MWCVVHNGSQLVYNHPGAGNIISYRAYSRSYRCDKNKIRHPISLKEKQAFCIATRINMCMLYDESNECTKWGSCAWNSVNFIAFTPLVGRQMGRHTGLMRDRRTGRHSDRRIYSADCGNTLGRREEVGVKWHYEPSISDKNIVHRIHVVYGGKWSLSILSSLFITVSHCILCMVKK